MTGPRVKRRKPKIMIWDIETSHSIAATFGIFKATIPHDYILSEWYIICAAWKWLGSDKIHTVKVGKDGNDRKVVQRLIKVIESADIVIGHNGDKFDLKKLKARAIYHDLPPIAEPKTIDTLKVAKKEFKFTSNRLDYLGDYFGVGRKVHTSPGLWLRVLKGDRAALKEMVDYNKQDVLLLEDVYLKMRGWIKNHPNLGLMIGNTIDVCPNCGSIHIEKHGFRTTRTAKFQRYRCRDCGATCSDGSSLERVKVR